MKKVTYQGRVENTKDKIEHIDSVRLWSGFIWLGIESNMKTIMNFGVA
jgi:hypothetical protein